MLDNDMGGAGNGIIGALAYKQIGRGQVQTICIFQSFL